MSGRDWLALDLAGPLMSFGGVAIDHVGPTRDHPGLAAITGLLANALGWARTEGRAHAQLQARLVMASALCDPGARLTDMQNAQLAKTDRGWTTRGAPEGRDGATYATPHRRARDYLADAHCVVVLTLEGQGAPVLDDLARALDRPARPLFIGRKPCLPAHPIGRAGTIRAADARTALCRAIAEEAIPPGLRRARPGAVPAQWPEGEGSAPGDTLRELADLRMWETGLPGGARRVRTGVLTRGGTA